MKRILRMILGYFVETTTTEYWEWTWDSLEERESFIKYFRFCN